MLGSSSFLKSNLTELDKNMKIQVKYLLPGDTFRYGGGLDATFGIMTVLSAVEKDDNYCSLSVWSEKLKGMKMGTFKEDEVILVPHPAFV